jgi:hypothetical protein
MSDKEDDAMRNTLHANMEELRASWLAFWLAVIDSLPKFLVRGFVRAWELMNEALNATARVILRAAHFFLGGRDGQ